MQTAGDTLTQEKLYEKSLSLYEIKSIAFFTQNLFN